MSVLLARQMEQRIDRQADEIEKLKERITNQRRELEKLNEVAARRARELDAMWWVWCRGGCGTGVDRFRGQRVRLPDEQPLLTEEIVELAEKNTERLRTWWESRKLQGRGIGAVTGPNPFVQAGVAPTEVQAASGAAPERKGHDVV